jgi:hypothetical protein
LSTVIYKREKYDLYMSSRRDLDVAKSKKRRICGTKKWDCEVQPDWDSWTGTFGLGFSDRAELIWFDFSSGQRIWTRDELRFRRSRIAFLVRRVVAEDINELDKLLPGQTLAITDQVCPSDTPYRSCRQIYSLAGLHRKLKSNS